MFGWLLDTTREGDNLNANLEGTTATTETPTFITYQTFTYAGAMTGIGALWKLAQNLVPGDITTGPLIPIIAAALIIAGSYAFAWSDMGGPSKRIAAAVVALFNGALLVAGALGISTALGSATL